jgi:uncharacterized protein YjiS (DUF1127 family)
MSLSSTLVPAHTTSRHSNRKHTGSSQQTDLIHEVAPSFFRHIMHVIADWRDRARQRRALRIACESSGLDDHLLKDIGVSRSQLLFEASRPFWLP